MSQEQTFLNLVNKLFFGVDVSNNKVSLLDNFNSVPQLHHENEVAKVFSLNVTAQEGTDAWFYTHEFTFKESPVTAQKIAGGTITVEIGEAGKNRKVTAVKWEVEFENKENAVKYFDTIKRLFDKVSTSKSIEFDKELGYINVL